MADDSEQVAFQGEEQDRSGVVGEEKEWKRRETVKELFVGRMRSSHLQLRFFDLKSESDNVGGLPPSMRPLTASHVKPPQKALLKR
jgi:hypothetical protein